MGTKSGKGKEIVSVVARLHIQRLITYRTNTWPQSSFLSVVLHPLLPGYRLPLQGEDWVEAACNIRKQDGEKRILLD
jgi:hypothetical protein